MGASLLKAFLDKNNESIAAFAARAGLAGPTISNLLNGKRGAGLEVALAIETATAKAVPAKSWSTKPRRRAA